MRIPKLTVELDQHEAQLVLLALSWFVQYANENGSAQRVPMTALEQSFREEYHTWLRHQPEQVANETRLQAAQLVRNAGHGELADLIIERPDS
jgi:hypothetical protein